MDKKEEIKSEREREIGRAGRKKKIIKEINR